MKIFIYRTSGNFVVGAGNPPCQNAVPTDPGSRYSWAVEIGTGASGHRNITDDADGVSLEIYDDYH